MALHLRRVLSGVAVGTVGDGGQGLVNDLSPRPQQLPQHQMPVLLLLQGLSSQGPEYRGEGGDGLRPAEAQDADGAWHGRCGDSCDGVGHGRSFPSPPCGNFGNSAVDFFLDCFYVYRNMNNGCFPPMWTSVENPVDNVENPVGQRSATYLPLFYIAYLPVYAVSKEFIVPYFLSGCQKN